MRRILLIAALLLVWVGNVSAVELKVKIPVSDYLETKARLESLEKENNELKEQARTLRSASKVNSSEPQVQSRLRVLEKENRALQESARSSVGNVGGSTSSRRTQELEAENAMLKKEIGFTAGINKKVSTQEQMMKDRLSLLARENTQLRNKVNRLQAGNMSLSGESHTARHAFRERKMAAQHLLLAKKNVVEFN